MQELQTKEAGPLVEDIKGALLELIEHLRRDASIVADARAAALFETSADVLDGLVHAYEHFATATEPAWKGDGMRSAAV
jgi:hypothetical protein